ncbi:MAG: hypothetical protein ACOH2A_03420 [Sphingobacteriaceae bacterium]
MKKLIIFSNPFVLLLIPVFFGIILGVVYQFKQDAHSESFTDNKCGYFQKTSIFKSTTKLFKEAIW